MIRRLALTLGLAAWALLGAAAAAEEVIDTNLLAAFQPPLPTEVTSKTNELTQEKIDLGRMIYYDKRFSKSQTLSCNSCHTLEKYGVDGEPTSPGHKGQRGKRNSPTVYNAAGHIAQFWDGRSPNVEVQSTMPMLDPVEMAMPSEQAVVTMANSIPGYVEAFKKAFPDDKDPVTFQNVQKALGAFERRLMTPSRWDKFLAGDAAAITDDEKKGFKEFWNNFCMTCHMGTLIGGNVMQKLGVVKPWPNLKDKGKFEVTKNPLDIMMFKSPSLRNVTKTGPYFHDGSEPNLEKAIMMMGRHQLAREITPAQAKSIATWFESLTGEIPLDYIKEPTLPESGPNTPKPDPN